MSTERDLEEAIVTYAVASAHEKMITTSDKTHVHAMMVHMGIKHERLMSDFLKAMVSGVLETYGVEPTDDTINAAIGAFNVGYCVAQGMAEAHSEVDKKRTSTASRAGAPRVRPRRSR